MNDENSVFENTETTPSPPCDTMETEIASERDSSNDAPEEQTFTGTDETAADLPANTGTNSDSDCENADSKTQESELEQLRSELKQLRKELALRNARAHQEERATREYAEFCDLYPDIPISSLTSEIWQNVSSGTPLAAAYALAEKKKAVYLKKVTESNANNRARSAGAVKNTENIEFSPAEVRAMSSQEVRANLSKIMRSMQKWH